MLSGSGFIDCATEEDAVKALNHLVEMSKNGGRQLVVKYALENEKDLLNVYVRNLPKTGFTKETLLNLFRPYGQVTSVKLLETDGAYTGTHCTIWRNEVCGFWSTLALSQSFLF